MLQGQAKIMLDEIKTLFCLSLFSYIHINITLFICILHICDLFCEN